MWAESPGTTDIVLQPCAADSRQVLVAVAVNLDFTLAAPVARIDHSHSDVAAEEAPGTLDPVGDDEVPTLNGGVVASEGNMQVAIGPERRLERVVDLVVERG